MNPATVPIVVAVAAAISIFGPGAAAGTST